VTLRLRLMLAFLLVVIVPLTVAAVVVGTGVPNALDTAARNRVSASRAGAVALIGQTCTTARLAAEVLAREAAAGDKAKAVADVVSRGLADYAVLSDGSGKVLGRAGHLTGSLAPAPAQLGSCSRHLQPQVGISAIADSVALRGTGGGGLGTVGVAVDLDASVVQRLAAAANAQVTLVSGARVLGSTLPPSTSRRLAAAASTLTDGTARVVGSRVAAAAAIGPGEPTVIVSVKRAGVGGLEALVVAVLIVALILAAVLGWLLARLATRPLVELSGAAERVAAGDLDTHIPVRSSDEVGQLAGTFNDMTDELRAYVTALQSSRDELRRSLARLGDTLSSTHDLGRILSVILETAVGTTRSAAGAIYIRADGHDELTLRAAHRLSDRISSGNGQVRVGEGVTGYVAQTGDAVRGNSGSDQLTLSPHEPKASEIISVPLRTTGGVLGVLNLYDRLDGQRYDDDDLETIQTFAGQAAVAMDNVLLHQEAQRLSITDGLTGLSNYRYFQQTLGREIERASRFGRTLALLMLDLDLFKQVNDTYGHQVGDAVLIEVADRVRAEVREVDVVARYGGEEFVVVLPETDLEGAAHIAKRIWERVRNRPLHVQTPDLRLTVSIGVAVFPEHGDSPSTLVRAADGALYSAKNAGRDRVCTAESNAEQSAQH
jgi:two-component system cell cycle response regulator